MSSQSDHFTRSARLALMLSQEEALRHNNAEIGTGHLLLALARLEKCIAMQVLRSLGVEAGRLMSMVEQAVGREQIPPSGRLSLAPDMEHAIQKAAEEARRMASVRVSTGHLLLGLVQEEKGVAEQALRGLGVDLDRLRTRTAHLIEEPGAENE